jgi:hypothetical protein
VWRERDGERKRERERERGGRERKGSDNMKSSTAFLHACRNIWGWKKNVVLPILSLRSGGPQSVFHALGW